MKQLTLMILALIVLASCNHGAELLNDKNTLLTSIDWTDPADEKPSLLTGVYNFNPDGTYTENYSGDKVDEKIIMSGTWKWISDDEISIVNHSMTINGEVHDLKPTEMDRYILRFSEITKDRVTAIKRSPSNIEDSWFSNAVNLVNAEK